MKNCTIYPMHQGSDEWHGVRAKCFTASEFAPFFLESRTEVQRKARKRIIRKKVRELLHQGAIGYDEWELAEIERDRNLEKWNGDIARGNAMEQTAREAYKSQFDVGVDQVGFIYNDGGFGCSPDGLIGLDGERAEYGIEIKSPSPVKFLSYLENPQDLLEDYQYQVHGSMCVTGLRRWDLWGFCNGFPPIHHVVTWGNFTDLLLVGLDGMVSEMQEYQGWLKEQFENWKK